MQLFHEEMAPDSEQLYMQEKKKKKKKAIKTSVKLGEWGGVY
jgi:hypothetical protein